MFTGLIQEIGTICAAQTDGANLNLTIAAPKLISEIKIGDSVCIAGVCLTATELLARDTAFRVSAVRETLSRTTLPQLRSGNRVNLELSIRAGDRFGGHFVQGHVDCTGRCESLREANGSWLLAFAYPAEYSPLLVEKGSISVEGVSLTAYDVGKDRFTVSVVPHTWEQTTLNSLRPGAEVNLEFDMLAKHIQRLLRAPEQRSITAEQLAKLGY